MTLMLAAALPRGERVIALVCDRDTGFIIIRSLTLY
jgi:hypothetical protein